MLTASDEIDLRHQNTDNKPVTLSNYRSAMKDLYKRENSPLSPEFKIDVKTIFQGIRRIHADYNQSGSVKNSESLSLIDGGFTLLFLVLTWNLMCRSLSTQQIRFEHLGYEEVAIGIRYFKTKTDEAGDKYRDPKHLYANLLCPTTCEFLAFAI
ncbi:hypothetical protein LEN26_017427 [Aphanomyces euteiches]|nr:hypothetical protein LEN26_017427 [Aphanomyces euteiches]